MGMLVNSFIAFPPAAAAGNILFDGIVAASGADYTTIQAGDDDLDTGAFSMLVKSGSYAGWTTSTANAYINIEPGSTITSAITISGDDCTVVLGAGTDVQGLVTLSGANCNLICRNGVDIDGISCSGLSFVSGGGWGSLSNGGTAVDGIDVTNGSLDSIVESIGLQTTGAGGGSQYAFQCVGTGDRIVANLLKIVNSDSRGMQLTGADTLVSGCMVMAADTDGISLQDQRMRVIGSHIVSSGDDNLDVGVIGDDSIMAGNISQDPTSDSMALASGGDDCVGVANRLDGVVNDSSTGSVIADNNTTAF